MSGCIVHPHQVAAATFLLLSLVLTSAAAGGPSNETSPPVVERDALSAIREALGSPLLDDSWVGIPCILPQFSTWIGIRCTGGRVTSVALEGLGLSGRLGAAAVSNLTALGVLSLRNNSISGNMMDFSSNPGVTAVDLSDNMFSGSISGSLLQLRRLSSLQLHNNNFTGNIPSFTQASLTLFNVSYNNLSGDIPATRTLLSFDSSSYRGNPGLCGPPTTTLCPTSNGRSPPAPDPQHKERNKIATSPLLLALGAVCVVGLVVLLALLYDYQKRLKTTEEAKEEHEGAAEDGARSCVINKESELMDAVAEEEGGRLVLMEGVGSFDTRQLLRSSAESMGGGSFGSCYKAILDGERTVMVKRLTEVKPLTVGEFESKMRALGRARHPNLLPLLGFYHSRKEKLLIYKFAPHGNLFDRIHGEYNYLIYTVCVILLSASMELYAPFCLRLFLQVAHGVARAMGFLHQRCRELDVIPHGNLKSSNVLLAENNTVLVSDYGLGTLISPSVAVQRMVAFKSPEYEDLRGVSMKSDVWSYGCLLLELITGRIPLHSAPPGVRGLDLGSWVHRAVREEWTAEILDAEVAGGQKRTTSGMVELLQLAVRCSDRQPEQRPEMEEVLREVEGIMPDISDDEEEDSSS
ncbi:hypothetical protein Taro_020738 [Colocasia esculenta]|uniref:Protein kinase domain-containing protein n=1 Tax=Colocasia esculenta TaxID=4460 RepID=A0A843UPE7_COLES|nr:hypothetical protein [Colocasia esculenta]